MRLQCLTAHTVVRPSWSNGLLAGTFLQRYVFLACCWGNTYHWHPWSMHPLGGGGILITRNRNCCTEGGNHGSSRVAALQLPRDRLHA